MKDLFHAIMADIHESLRARWFLVYTLVFGGIIVALFVSELTESRVMGFAGLSRMLVTYLQLTMAILPIFVLITIVRSVAGDRESGVVEYLLSLPISLSAWYWGKLSGRFIVVFLPVFLAMFAAVVWAMFQGLVVPWHQLAYYTGLLFSLICFFLGIGMLISTMARSYEVAQGAAFIVWLVLLLFLDLILMGVLIQSDISEHTVIVFALLNPLQVFRTAAMMLFDPQLILLGPAAYVILDAVGQTGYLIWAVCYPVGLGLLCALLGYQLFRRGDLL